MIQAFLLQAGVLLTAIAAMAPPLHGESVAELWNSPSQLTPAQACEVLGREADGEILAPKELFEAEKYLRTDGDVSLSLYVATKVPARIARRPFSTIRRSFKTGASATEAFVLHVSAARSVRTRHTSSRRRPPP